MSSFGDLGIAAGVGQGLQNAVSMYLQTQNMLQENEIKKRLANAQGVDAWGKALHEGGSKMANAAAAYMGIPNAGSGVDRVPAQPAVAAATHLEPDAGGGLTSVPNSPGMLPGNSQPASQAQSPQGPSDADQELRKSYEDSLLYGAGAQRDAVAAAGAAKYALAKNPNAQQAFQQQKAGLVNTQQEPAKFIMGQAAHDAPVANAIDAAQSFNKIQENYNNPSANGSVESLVALAKLINPGYAPAEGTLAELKKLPGFYNRFKNAFEVAASGQAFGKEMNDDIMRAAANAGNSIGKNYQKQMSGKWEPAAKSFGVDASLIHEPTVVQMQADAKQWQKQLGAYVPAQKADLAKAQQTGVGHAVSSGFKGLVHAGESALSGFLPGKEEGAASDSAQPQVSEGDRKILEKELSANPNGPRAVRIKALLGR